MKQGLLVCTDLDRTLIPNGVQPESPAARMHFARLVEHDQVVLAYVSGRDRSLVLAAIADYQLPWPDYVLADVGTSIYALDAQHDWQRLREWDRAIAQDWHGHTRADLARLLEGIDALQLQEASRQSDYKLSYYLPLSSSQQQLYPVIEQRLQAVNIAARQIWSVDENAGVGLLDILPRRASKLHAIEALMQQRGFSADSTVFCGDSGNDIEVLASCIPAVLVANATPDVRELARNSSQQQHCSEQLYIASGGFHGMNGCYSAGMLEGIAHYYPESVDWMGFSVIEKQS